MDYKKILIDALKNNYYYDLNESETFQSFEIKREGDYIEFYLYYNNFLYCYSFNIIDIYNSNYYYELLRYHTYNNKIIGYIDNAQYSDFAECLEETIYTILDDYISKNNIEIY